MENWKRKYTAEDMAHSPCCCVWLENFIIEEEIIELHWNPGNLGHIFHIECINGWSEKEKTCPLCRKNFIDLIKQEERDGLINKRLNEEEKEFPR